MFKVRNVSQWRNLRHLNLNRQLSYVKACPSNDPMCRFTRSQILSLRRVR